ncbi:zinc finger and BTB domain-containing protein 41 isoform X5 [Musca domestica]|uniref:Zinc finger and BTB domain-containing protein 41 isoform X5 n=1 Tax=Musca domestica TaxID=7370 RepID=A0A9J7DIP4_MUSDO|nr:zinc finger and BTB domain-containing protein 41 isoform X5 [Musca domestica]
MDDVVKLEYLVCGEILAPISVNAKEQFFLKCLECDEYFTMLEEFIMHYQYCHNDKFKMTMHSPDTSNAQYQREVDIQYADECQEDRDIHEENDVEEVKDENEENYEAEYALVNESQDNIDEDFGEEEVHNFKDSEGEDGSGDDDNEIGDNEIDDNEVDEDAEIEMYDEENDKADDDDELLQDADDSQEEYDDEGSQDFDRIETSNNDDERIGEGSNAKSFICEFLKSDSNYKAVIEAYQNEPRLWNTKEFPNVLNDAERNECLERIALEIKNTQKIELNSNQVDLLIHQIRRTYIDNIKRFKNAEQREAAAESNRVPLWYFNSLSFLESIVNEGTDVKSVNRRHLKREQILQMIDIYKKFPHLWNTNLPENVCANKRQEAIQRMKKTLRIEMGLKIKVCSLKNYLETIHAHFYNEKSNIINQGKRGKPNSAFFDRMLFLNDHVGPFICKFCGRRHRSPLAQKVHIYQSHHQKDPLKCLICAKIYEKTEPYVAHVRRHMSDLPDECKECGKRFIRAADLRLHMRTHTGVKPYCCEICGAAFTLSSALQSHIRRHKKEYRHYCEICLKGFPTKHEMECHIPTHTNERKYRCSICGKAFKCRKTTRIHETTHVEGRHHPCPLCGKMFKNDVGVKQHLRTHRINENTSTSSPLI